MLSPSTPTPIHPHTPPPHLLISPAASLSPSTLPTPKHLFSTLPTELLVHILRLAASPYLNVPTATEQPDLPPVNVHSPRFLASLATVHRSWTPVVEELLVRNLYVGPKGLGESLRGLLKRRSEEGKVGCRNLVLEGPAQVGWEDAWEEGEVWKSEEMWKGVRGLRIMGGDDRAMEVLKRCSNLRLLIVHGSQNHFTLSGVSPTLRQLVLVDTARLSLLTPLKPSDVPHLRSLVLDLNGRTMSSFVARRVPLPNQNHVGAGGGFSFLGGGAGGGGGPGGGTAIWRMTAGGANGGGVGARRPPRAGGARIQINATAPRPAPPIQYTYTEPDLLPPMPLLPQIVSLTLRLHSSPYAHPFLHSLLDSETPSCLRHLRLYTSGATEPWLSLLPLLEILNGLPLPLSTLHIDYALLEPLLYRVSRQPAHLKSASIPKSLSSLDALILSHFLGFANGTEGATQGLVVRRVTDVGSWGDLESLGNYLRPFARAGADGGRGMRCELRKMPKALIDEEEEVGQAW